MADSSPDRSRREAMQKLRTLEQQADSLLDARLDQPDHPGSLDRQAARAGIVAWLRWRLALVLSGLTLFLLVLPPFYYPLTGIKTSGFFLRTRPETGLITDVEIHRGIDIAAPTGTPVKTSALGRVAVVDQSPGYGNFVIVHHPLGLHTVYAHLDSVAVQEGQFAVPGITTLGGVGMTGRATGPHLHFEVGWGRLPLSPEAMLIFHNLRRRIIGF